MATSTNLVEVGIKEYVNVSNGNINCYVGVEFGSKFKVVVGGEQPKPDNEVYFLIHVPSDRHYDGWRIRFGVENLSAEAEIWMMASDEPEDVVVIRGDSRVVGGWDAI
jgi:hypothetical protein